MTVSGGRRPAPRREPSGTAPLRRGVNAYLELRILAQDLELNADEVALHIRRGTELGHWLVSPYRRGEPA